jgi:hypothetical protein
MGRNPLPEAFLCSGIIELLPEKKKGEPERKATKQRRERANCPKKS